MPTPSSEDNSEVRGQKRKRDDARRRDDHDGSGPDDDEDSFTRDYDPNQEPEMRRKIMRESRVLEREFQGQFRPTPAPVRAGINGLQRNAMI